MVSSAAMLLLLLLPFLAGLLNIYFYATSKELYSWLQSFLFKNPAASSKVSPQVDMNTTSCNSKNNGALKSVFATFDKNGDGFITKQELRESLKNVRIFMTEKEVEEMVAKSRRGGDLKEAFDVFDRNKDGLISVEELGLVLSSLGLNEGKRIEDWKEMIRKVDMDGDGMVNFDEFKRMMRNGSTKLIPVC
ncbi:hypothetical protein GH714_015384 [Hevea brasiliensis]|uniref:EF-hand domain-containing protein n=1 Tax=Hevea brasiliensis TaxID=3981 RepID=A0A6A6MDQ6_HEVBR|nr:hypothetical protein GH714_015384 [Hevea brasiliensis]